MNGVVVISKPSDARKILSELLLTTDLCIEEAYLYGKSEIAIYLLDGSIYCDIYDDDYTFEKDDIVFLLNDCSSSIIHSIHSDYLFEVSIGDDFICDKQEKNDKQESRYKIYAKAVDKKTYDTAKMDIRKRFETFDDEYSDMLMHSLLFQCSYRDLYNQLLKDILL